MSPLLLSSQSDVVYAPAPPAAVSPALGVALVGSGCCSIARGRGDPNIPPGFASSHARSHFFTGRHPRRFLNGCHLLRLLFKTHSWGVLGSWLSPSLAVLGTGSGKGWGVGVLSSCGELHECTA